jgi:hypothetical protein
MKNKGEKKRSENCRRAAGREGVNEGMFPWVIN